MAAPIKDGLSYFNCECHFDDKVELLIAEFGMKGLGILVVLWQKIYDNGYFCEWNDDVALMFCKKVGEGVNVVSEVIACCLRRGIFDCGMYDKCNILTSHGIQKRYLEACKRRTRIVFDKRYLLIDVPDNCIIVNNNSVNDNNNSENDSKNSLNKSNESKVKKSKVNTTLDIPTEIKPAWDAFVEMRKKKKKPLTDYAAKLAYSKLLKLAPDNYELQIAILNQSTFRCWDGLFELKDEGGGYNGQSAADFKPSRR